jgi:hypothetical protein
MNYEVNGRDDFEAALDGDDLKITGLTSNHVEVENLDPKQKVVYSLGAAPSFPGDWSDLGPGEKVQVRLGGATQINFRKKVFYRNVLRNPDNSTRLNDVTVTVSATEVDLHS